ncbi:MAG: protein kinase, partial [Planctomycetes bacterium]|nr:protein kinase [Planctomycetota bacterium]
MTDLAMGDLLLGQLVIRKGLASPDNVEECLAEQAELAARGAPPTPLGAILLRKGHLTDEAIEGLLAAQHDTLRSYPNSADARKADVRFAKEIVARGLVPRDRLDEAAALQERLRARGLPLLLGEILIARGLLSEDQVRRALFPLHDTVLICARCAVAFNVEGYISGAKVRCPTCGGPMVRPFAGTRVFVRRSSRKTTMITGDLANELEAARRASAARGRPTEASSAADGEAAEPAATAGRAPVGATAPVALAEPGEGDTPSSTPSPPPTPTPPSPISGLSPVSPASPVGLLSPILPLPPTPPPAGRRASARATHAPPMPPTPTPLTPALFRDAGEGDGASMDEDSPLEEPRFKPPPPSEATGAFGPNGRPFGRYRLLDEIGRGGMGVVYKAWDGQLERVIAIKMLLSESAARSHSVDRFVREARSMARLRHPAIVQVHDVSTFDERHYFTMDYIPSEPLHLAARRLSRDRFLSLLSEVALALHHAHQAGVVHRDVKPPNILVDRTGRPFVTDFGLAKEIREPADEGVTVTGAVLGTPQFMSPEQAGGRTEEITPRTDVWALGVILYEQLTGRLPFEGKSIVEVLMAILSKDPVPPSRVPVTDGRRERVPADLETICLRCLEKDPARRYPEAADFASDLIRFLAGEPILARPVSAPARFVRRLLRRKAVLFPTAVAVLLAAALPAYVLHARALRIQDDQRAQELADHLDAAVHAKRAGDVDGAAAHFTAAHDLSPESKDALAGLAWVQEKRRETASLRAAESLARGRASLGKHDLAGARKQFREAEGSPRPET